MPIRRLVPLAALAATALLISNCSSDAATRADTSAATTPATTSPATTAPASTTPETTATPSTVPASTVAPFVSETYADATHWICRGDTTDICDDVYPTTVIAADGSTSLRTYEIPADPPVDCFYAYPTISEDQTLNSDLTAGSEIGVTSQQAAPLGQICTVYAPMYRSVTLAGLFDPTLPGDKANAWQVATDDVAEAWKHYLANDNHGRGVILIGHSQGAGHLANLLKNVIDPDPYQRSLLVSAYIIGGAIAVPEGADVGGDLQHIALCRSMEQTGCAVTYATFRSTAPPPADSFFGRPMSTTGAATEPAGCVNPAAPGGGSAELSSTMSSGDWVLTDGSLAPTTPFVDTPGLLTAQCTTRDGFTYLEVTVHGDPADPRADDISGDLSPQWGLHMVDIPVAGGSIVALAQQQIAAYVAAQG